MLKGSFELRSLSKLVRRGQRHEPRCLPRLKSGCDPSCDHALNLNLDLATSLSYKFETMLSKSLAAVAVVNSLPLKINGPPNRNSESVFIIIFLSLRS